ncbi:hypothetical protein MZE11_19615, partial [Bacillus amyloliquefaciens]|uniref:hypothetical protein n=1 Tax=Bacillus amyloliquefaciens TaxID=1390 RepID=UPI00211A525D
MEVRSLPLKPPQAAPAPEKAVRRPWHPVMWEDSAPSISIEQPDQELDGQCRTKEYPHKQRIRNLKRLIAEGKVKP